MQQAYKILQQLQIMNCFAMLGIHIDAIFQNSSHYSALQLCNTGPITECYNFATQVPLPCVATLQRSSHYRALQLCKTCPIDVRYNFATQLPSACCNFATQFPLSCIATLQHSSHYHALQLCNTAPITVCCNIAMLMLMHSFISSQCIAAVKLQFCVVLYTGYCETILLL